MWPPEQRSPSRPPTGPGTPDRVPDGAQGRPRDRRALALLLALAGGIGCRPDDEPADAAPEPGAPVADAAGSESAPAAEAPGEDALVIALRRLPGPLDPFGELDPWGQRAIDDLVFEGLTRRSDAGAPWSEPALAERCELEADRDVVCLLRAGARFHDGAEVTAEDALYSLGQWLGPRGQGLRQRFGLDGLRAVERIEGPPGGPKDSSGRWLRLSFEQRDPLALEKIAAMKIVPKLRHQQGGGRFAAQPVGSGPFRLVAQDEARMVFERVAPAPGRARRVVLRAIEDGAAALTALRRGEVHLLAEVAPVHVPKELGKPGMAARFAAHLVSPARYDLLLFNMREGLQAGPRMRAALDLAVPRAELAQLVYGLPGLALTAPVDLHAPAPIDLAAIAEGRDAEAGLGPLALGPDFAADAAARAQADAILTELGWIHERGVRRRQSATLRVPLTWDGSPGLATGIVKSLRGGWKEIGIQAPSVTAGWPYVLANLLRPGKYALALVRLAGSADLDLHPWFHSRGAHNLVGVADGILDAALDSYRDATTREGRDAAKRAVAERLSALRPVAVLHAPLLVTLVSRAVTGLEFVDDLPRLDRLGLASERRRDPFALGESR